ncbi:hypothetical protein JIN84_12810 [Luteolibacter yonseiensis]|uniref:Uncharacterized protein n=1 Tax=Luteolibacter yonseiensis TaxID=1144680 RepID=A0A934R7F7_9BACT|nr:hypothetical protein [Luteolibacter yonseiensis]MBK1816499.1 hypothetical protein [Luteolibacter yonseiensis]
MDFTDRDEWPDHRVIRWIDTLRKPNPLGLWSARHLAGLEAEAHHRNLKIP